MIQKIESKKFDSFQDIIQQNITQNAHQIDFQDLYDFKGSFQPFQLQQIMECFNISDIINDEQAYNIYHSLNQVPQKRSLSDQEQNLLKWLLIRLYAIQPFKMDYIPRYVWSKISYFLRRPLSSLRVMQHSIQKYNVNKFPWSHEEDKLLFNIVRKRQVVQSNGKKLVRNSDNILSLNIQDNQDNVERGGVEQVGRKWALIARKLNRNENQVKNKYNSIIKKEEASQKLQYKQSQICKNQSVLLIQQNETPDLNVNYDFAFANMQTKEIYVCGRQQFIELLQKKDLYDTGSRVLDCEFFTPFNSGFYLQ